MKYGMDVMCESRATGELMLRSGTPVTKWNLCYGVELTLLGGVYVMEWTLCYGAEFTLWSGTYVI